MVLCTLTHTPDLESPRDRLLDGLLDELLAGLREEGWQVLRAHAPVRGRAVEASRVQRAGPRAELREAGDKKSPPPAKS